MGFKEILTTRTQKAIEGVIDIENINAPAGAKIEADPERFLSLTYATSDIKRIIQGINSRFSEKDGSAGLFLLEAEKGLGKSHDLVLVYHLFNSPDLSRGWLETNELECALPENPIIVIRKLTDKYTDQIWNIVFDALSYDLNGQVPTVDHLNEALEEKQLILILDELERGIQGIPDRNKRIQNINFMQMLSEAANRSNAVTIFASVYDSSEEPGSTLARVAHESIQFLNNDDKARVVQHRLFTDFESRDQKKVNGIVASYVNKMKKSLPELDGEAYTTKLKTTYPFSPELMDVLYQRIPTLKSGWQGVRGSLGYLFHQVEQAGGDVDIISVAHSNMEDERNWTHWRDLDPTNNMLPNIQSDFSQLKKIKGMNQLMAVIALYTLSGADRTRGVDEQTLLLNCLFTDLDINDFQKGKNMLQKFAPHIQVSESRIFFSLDENTRAKVEYRATQILDTDAYEKLEEILLNDVYMDKNAILYYGAPEEFENKFGELQKDRIRTVIAPKALSNEEIYRLYHGKEKRNRILLLEPAQQGTHLLHDENLLQWAKRQLAAMEMATLAPNHSKRNEYERINREEHESCIQHIKNNGFTLLTWESFGSKPSELVFDREKLRDARKEEVLQYMMQNIYPNLLIRERLEDRLEEIFDSYVEDIVNEYHITLGFPVLVKDSQFPKILRDMARDKVIGIRHGKGTICGVTSHPLNDRELMEAIISKPWETATVETAQTETGIGPTGDFPEIPSETGEIGFPDFGRKVDTITTPQSPSKNELKQSVASRLIDRENDVINKVIVRVFFEKETGELSNFDAALRGGLSGAGKLSTEITIEKQGPFSKAEVEDILDKLPSYTDNAFYTCELAVVKSEVTEEV